MLSNLPFAEKYKPKNTSQLILNDILEKKIKQSIETKTIPNLILCGRSGSGKTATIHAIAIEFYPKDFTTPILEVNASDDRGIKIVNETIVDFCKTCVEYKEGYAQQKLVILDEADNLTTKAQKLISSTMDEYPNVAFAITCNNISSIIPSINSRCVPIEMSTLPIELVIKRLIEICKLENIEYDEHALQYLFEFNNHNFRQTLNILEFVYQSCRSKITVDVINDVCGIPSEELFNKIIDSLNSKNIKELCKSIVELQSNGYYAIDVLIYFIQYIRYHEYGNKMLILEILCEYSFVMSSNTSNYLQLTRAFIECLEKIPSK